MTRDEIIAGLKALHDEAMAESDAAERRRVQYETALLALAPHALDGDEPELAAPTEVTGAGLTLVGDHGPVISIPIRPSGWDWVDPEVRDDDAKRAAAKAEHPSAPRPAKVGGFKPATDHAEVASIARRAKRAGASPAKAVARHYDITEHAAQQRIGKARRLGHDTTGNIVAAVEPPDDATGGVIAAADAPRVGERPIEIPANPTSLGPPIELPDTFPDLGPIERRPFDPDATREAAGPPPQGPVQPLATRPTAVSNRPANPKVGDVWTPERALAILDDRTPDDAA